MCGAMYPAVSGELHRLRGKPHCPVRVNRSTASLRLAHDQGFQNQAELTFRVILNVRMGERRGPASVTPNTPEWV